MILDIGRSISTMDLTQLANLGEFIGGVAVLVTLIYLAIQVRQGTQAVEASNHNALVDYVGNFDVTIARDPEFAEFEARGAADPDSLSDLEWRRFRGFAMARFGGWEAAFINHRKGVVDADTWAAFDGGFRLLLTGPGYARFWSEAGPAHAPSFRDYIDRQVIRS